MTTTAEYIAFVEVNGFHPDCQRECKNEKQIRAATVPFLAELPEYSAATIGEILMHASANIAPIMKNLIDNGYDREEIAAGAVNALGEIGYLLYTGKPSSR